MKTYFRVLKLAKFRKYWFIKVGERSEPRKFWKNCVFNHKIWANSEIRTFALPKSGGGGTNPLVPPPTFESGGGGHVPPCPPSPTPLEKLDLGYTVEFSANRPPVVLKLRQRLHDKHTNSMKTIMVIRLRDKTRNFIKPIPECLH